MKWRQKEPVASAVLRKVTFHESFCTLCESYRLRPHCLVLSPQEKEQELDQLTKELRQVNLQQFIQKTGTKVTVLPAQPVEINISSGIYITRLKMHTAVLNIKQKGPWWKSSVVFGSWCVVACAWTCCHLVVILRMSHWTELIPRFFLFFSAGVELKRLGSSRLLPGALRALQSRVSSSLNPEGIYVWLRKVQTDTQLSKLMRREPKKKKKSKQRSPVEAVFF